MVPAISETIARSSPRRALTRDDLPTFGRPTTASAISSRASEASPVSARQPPADRVLQVVDAGAVLGGHAVDLGKSERPRLGLPFQPLATVDLVRDDDALAAGFADDARRRPVAGQDPRRRIDDEQHEVRLPDRRDGLLADGRGDFFAPLGIVAAGVHEEVVPFVGQPRFRLEDVAGHSGHVVDDRPAAADQPVEEGGLADIRSARDDDSKHVRFLRPRTSPESPSFARRLRAGA